MQSADQHQVSDSPAGQGSEGLTLGVELEFVLIGDKSEIQHLLGRSADSTDDGDSALKLVANALSEDGTVLVHNPEDIVGDLFCPELKKNEEAYSKWTISNDITVMLTRGEWRHLPETYIQESVELRSRIFNLAHDDAKGEIAHVLSILHAKLNTNITTIRLLTNNTCGFHIHVGKSPDGTRTFPLRTLKSLYQLATGFERAIDALHSADRITSARQELTIPATCIAPPSARFLNDADKRALRDAGPLDWCAYVERALQHELDVGARLTAWNKHIAYNLNNTTVSETLWGRVRAGMRRSPYKKWTVEFRQHRGTLDAGEVGAWMDVVVAMVGFAERCEPELLQDLLVAHVRDPEFGPGEFLRTVGVPEAAVVFYERQLRGKVDVPPVLRHVDEEVNRLLTRNRLDTMDRRSPQSIKYAVVQKLVDRQYGNVPLVVLHALLDSIRKMGSG